MLHYLYVMSTRLQFQLQFAIELCHYSCFIQAWTSHAKYLFMWTFKKNFLNVFFFSCEKKSFMTGKKLSWVATCSRIKNNFMWKPNLFITAKNRYQYQYNYACVGENKRNKLLTKQLNLMNNRLWHQTVILHWKFINSLSFNNNQSSKIHKL